MTTNETPHDHATVHSALLSLRDITHPDDMRWLSEAIREIMGLRPDLRGLPGGFDRFKVSPAAVDLRASIRELNPGDLRLILDVVEYLHDLLRPQTGDSLGVVDLKTIFKTYTDIDFKTGLPEIDPKTGAPVTVTIGYTYCYIRLHAAHGGKDRKMTRFLSIYADKGMGRGGSGGYVAWALSRNLITEREILAAWHLGKDAYFEFIEQCKEWASQ